MRLLSWNVARRATRLDEQAAAVASREPDVVALQEITTRSWPRWCEMLARVGLGHAACSLEGADPKRAPAGPRRTGVLVLAREEVAPLGQLLDVPWPESALSVRAGAVEVHVAHVPQAANGWIKPRTLAAIRAGLAARPRERLLFCGDLNTPRREIPEHVSFARTRNGRLRPERGTEWDEAELGVVPGLADLGLQDCFRALHPDVKEVSFQWQWGGGWRLDHAFASPDLRPVAARYHHEWRDAQLSDHAPLEVDLELHST